MHKYKTVLSQKQLASALAGLDRDAKLSLRLHGDCAAFREQFTLRADELWDTVSPQDCERASAGIGKIVSELGIRANVRALSAAA